MTIVQPDPALSMCLYLVTLDRDVGRRSVAGVLVLAFTEERAFDLAAARFDAAGWPDATPMSIRMLCEGTAQEWASSVWDYGT